MINTQRLDLSLITELVTPNSRVLDLGCGDGSLLQRLFAEKHIRGQGIDHDLDSIAQCLQRDVFAIQADLEDELSAIPSDRFDFVILSQTLQEIRQPGLVIREMLRVGKHCIITFPNFAHWKIRAELALLGRMPISRTIPYSWHETPNIHHTTLRDFRAFIRDHHAVIEREYPLTTHQRSRKLMAKRFPNVFADTIVAVVRQ